VTSTRFPKENVDDVRVYSLFGNITFQTTTKMLDGTIERCVFVGKLKHRTITGRWYDPKDEGRGYYGVYQVNLHGTLREGDGHWSGWASDGTVQSNSMRMVKLP
jgi:hypothetical protein